MVSVVLSGLSGRTSTFGIPLPGYKHHFVVFVFFFVVVLFRFLLGVAVVLERLQRCRTAGGISNAGGKDDGLQAVGKIESVLADTLWQIKALQLQRGIMKTCCAAL